MTHRIRHFRIDQSENRAPNSAFFQRPHSNSKREKPVWEKTYFNRFQKSIILFDFRLISALFIRVIRTVHRLSKGKLRIFKAEYRDFFYVLSFLTLRKFWQIFLKIKQPGPPVRNMSRHKQEVIKLLITAKEPVKTVISRLSISAYI